jgi:hypothetical protein
MLKAILLLCLISDQLYNWSDEYSQRDCLRPSQTTQRSCAPSAPTAIDPARFPHRAIQAVRQTGVQMRRGSGTWSQVLPLGKLSRPAAADGLRAAGERRAGRGVSGQFSAGTRDPGADLRDQPRTATPPRGALRWRHERIADRQLSTELHGAGRAARQYADELAGRGSGAIALDGGQL